MKWFRNRNTAVKLILAFGAVSLLMGVIGYLGVSGMSAVNTTVGTLYQRELVGLLEIKDANISLLSIARDVRGALMQTDVAKMTPFARDGFEEF